MSTIIIGGFAALWSVLIYYIGFGAGIWHERRSSSKKDST